MKLITYKRKLFFLAFSLILSFGIIVNLRGQVGPLIQDYYQLTYTQFGFALSFFSIGGIFFNILAGILIDRVGLKKVILNALLLTIVGLIIVYIGDTYLFLVIAMIVMGTGATVLNLSATSLVSRISIQDKGRAMNFFHFFFGLGGIIAPVYANKVLNLGFNWKFTYLFLGILLFFLIIVSISSAFPRVDKENSKNTKKLKEVIKDTRVLLFVLMFLFYCGAELGVSSWLSLYLNNVQQRSQQEISFYLSFFFFCFTFGRLAASYFVEKVGYFKWIFIAVSTAVFFILSGMLGPDSMAFMFSLTGLSLAGIFPTLQAIMFSIFKPTSMSTILGATLTAASTGFMIFGDWIVGWVNDLVGIRLGFGIVIIYLLVFFSLFIYLKRKYIN